MSTTTTKILSVVFFIISIGLASFLVLRIKYDIDEEQRIKTGEAKIIERLKLIREAELVYQEVNRKFTDDWDALIAFLDTGTYYITEKTEEIITLEYGADSVVVHVDTLDQVPARQRVFEELNYINAASDGFFIEYLVDMGTPVSIGSKVYRLQPEGKEKINTLTATLEGEVTDLAPLSRGDRVSKGQQLITLLHYKFDPDFNIERLPYVPTADDDTKFEIFADKINKSGVMVDVIEVKNPKSVDPERDESNEQRNRQPLRFGSRTEVTTAGNWE